MYWRVRKYTPEQLFRLYGVYIALATSVFMNMILLLTRPNLNRLVTPEVKADFDSFSRKVTQHILDTSYITYYDSTSALMSSELSPPVVQMLQQQQTLPKSLTELKATAKTYTAQRRVSAVRIDEVEVRQNDMDRLGRIPVDVSGVVAVHSAEEADPGPVPFKFRFMVGRSTKEPHDPLVASFQDLSPPGR